MVKQADDKFIRYCLWACVVMVFIMIGLGGYTRLSGAGLSMVTWQPLRGILPPLTEAAWSEVFQQYQQSPEFQKINFAMTVQEFKRIFLIEYFHRLWGRAIGLMLLVPTIYAAFKARYILPKLGFIWLLGGLQGFMGWYMVKSGLVNDPMVSPYRLLAHLALALVILGALLHTIFELKDFQAKKQNSALARYMLVIAIFLGITIAFGALTAGFHGGLIYNTFPKMNGNWLPEELFFYQPWWLDLLSNPATLQFTHRTLAITTLVLGFYTSFVLWSAKKQGIAIILSSALSLQVILGIMTLVMQVPVFLGVVHQLWAVLVFSMTIWSYMLLKNSKALLSPRPHIPVASGHTKL